MWAAYAEVLPELYLFLHLRSLVDKCLATKYCRSVNRDNAQLSIPEFRKRSHYQMNMVRQYADLIDGEIALSCYIEPIPGERRTYLRIKDPNTVTRREHQVMTRFKDRVRCAESYR